MQKALLAATHANHKIGIARVHFLLAFYEQTFEATVKSLLETAREAETAGDRLTLCDCIAYISDAHSMRGDAQVALAGYLRNIQFHRTMGNRLQELSHMFWAARTIHIAGSHKLAGEIYEVLTSKIRLTGASRLLDWVELFLADVMLEIGDPYEAERLLSMIRLRGGPDPSQFWHGGDIVSLGHLIEARIASLRGQASSMLFERARNSSATRGDVLVEADSVWYHWRTTPVAETRQMAVEVVRRAYEKIGDPVNRARLEELTGTRLDAPIALPDCSSIFTTTLSLDELYAQIFQIVSSY